MITITNLDQVFKTLDAWMAQAEAMTTKFCRGTANLIFNYTLENSVQYSGDFAANWRLSLNAPDPTFVKGAVAQGEPTATWKYGGKNVEEKTFTAFLPQAESNAAKAYARRENQGKLAGFKLGDTIYLANSAEHDEPYAVGIDEGTIKLRDPKSAAPLTRAKHQAVSEIALGGYRSATRTGSFYA